MECYSCGAERWPEEWPRELWRSMLSGLLQICKSTRTIFGICSDVLHSLNSSVDDQWICVSPGRISEHVVSIAPLLKRVPIRSLSNAEQCGLQKHLRRSYTKPLEVDPFQWPFFVGDSGTAAKEEKKSVGLPEIVAQKQEHGMVSMEQDSEVNSDSGKGTAVSAASPVQEVRRKRKSKSFSPPELEQTETEDSGIQQKETVNKHLKLVKSSYSRVEGDVLEKKKKKKTEMKKQKSSSSCKESSKPSKKLGLKMQMAQKEKHKHELAKNKATGLVSVQKSQYLKMNMIKQKKDMKQQRKKGLDGEQLRKSVSSTKKDKC